MDGNSPLLMGDLAFRPLSLVTPHIQKYSGSSKATPSTIARSLSPSTSPKGQNETSDDERISNRSSSKRSGSAGGSHKEKGKIPDTVDLSVLSGNFKLF